MELDVRRGVAVASRQSRSMYRVEIITACGDTLRNIVVESMRKDYDLLYITISLQA